MKRKILSIIFILILILSMTFSTTYATSTSLDDAKNKIDDKIDEAKNEQAEVKSQMSDAMKEVQELNSSIAKSEEELESLENKTKQLNNQIKEIQKKIDEATEKYNKQYDALCDLVVAQYENGSAMYLDVLLNSTSLSNFLSKYYIISEIVQYDNDLLEQIQNEKETIIKSKEELEVKQKELKEATVEAQKANIVLKNNKAKQQSYIDKLSDEEKELQNQIEEYKKQRQQIEDEISRIAQNNVTSTGYVYTGGRLTWPCPNYSRISSYYGYRGYAATGGVGSSNHKGIDLAASRGASIVAADSGIVIKVSNTCTHNYPKTYNTRCSCGGGFGNYIMISHGGGLVTLYGHCTDIYVSVGQTVSAGQQIGTVGCTGYSTGNHLHFSVLLNGAYVNPAPYLGMQ